MTAKERIRQAAGKISGGGQVSAPAQSSSMTAKERIAHAAQTVKNGGSLNLQPPKKTETIKQTRLRNETADRQTDAMTLAERRNEAARRQTEARKQQEQAAATQTPSPAANSPLLAPLARAKGTTYPAGGTTDQTTHYAAGAQAGIVKTPERKEKPKKENPVQEATAPAWMGLTDQSAAELEQRHKTAITERNALRDRVKQGETPTPNSTYAASAGGYKPKEANPIPSSAAASGAWMSEEDKRLLPIRLEQEHKQTEINDLAAAHYHRKNQEQFAKLSGDYAAAASYRSAKELTADLEKVRKAIDAPSGYNGMDSRFSSDGAAVMRKYGVNDLDELERILTEQKARRVSELANKGYDFETMAGYDQMLSQQETYVKAQEKWQKDAEEHPVSMSGLSVFLSPLQGADAVRTWGNSVGHSNADDLGSYVPNNVYDMYATNAVQTIRGTVAKKIEENTDWELFGQNVASFLYNTGMSVADSALQVATLGSGATFVMGLSSAANTTKEIIERGGSNEQAFWGGLAAGVAECVFEEFSVEHILKLDFGEGWKGAVKAVLSQAGVEASEEMLTEIANILSDTMVMGERSGMSTAIRRYEEQGLTKQEAGLRATLDSLGQIGWAGAGGALSGLGMAGGKLAIQRGSNAIYDGFTKQRQGDGAFATMDTVGAHTDVDTGVDAPTMQNHVEGAEMPSTAIDANPTTHTAQQQAVINEYQAAADKGILAFIERWRGLKDPNYRKKVRMDIAPVDQRTVTDIKAKTGVDVSDFTGHSLSGNALEHIDLRHGTKGEADQSMADLNDIARMGYVLEHYDSVEQLLDKQGNPVLSGEYYNADGSRAPMVRFQKRVDGTYYVVEAVPDAATREFRVVSAYMQKGSDSTGQELTYHKSDPQLTSKTHLDAHTIASMDSIPQSSADVNTETGDGMPNSVGAAMGVDAPAAESPVEGVKNTHTEGMERVYHGQVLDTVRGHLNEVRGMSAVAHLTGSEFQKQTGDARPLRTKVVEFFNSLGNKVTRPDIGDIALTGAGARDSTAHGYGKLKAATFAALPSVLKDGKIIEVRGPYGGHSYDSIFISAPVEVDGATHYVGALVIKDANTQRYKLHEVLTTNESGTPLFKSETTSNADGPLRSDAPLGTSGDVPTMSSIPQTAQDVNTETGDGMPNSVGAAMGVDTPAAESPAEGVKNAPTEGAGGNVRLTETDTAEYMATGKKKSVRDAKAAEVERGGKVVLTTAQETQEFIGDAIRGVAGQTTKAYGKIGTEMAGEIRAVSGSDIDVTGWFLELVPYDLRHAFEQHAKAKREGNIDLTEQDFLNIPDYIDSYDDILEVRTFKSGDREVVVGKKINGYSVIVELMSNNRKSLHFKNMWGLDTQTYESRYGKRSTVSHPDRSSVSANDPTEVYRDASSVDSISQTAQDVNPENGDAGYWDSLMESVPGKRPTRMSAEQWATIMQEAPEGVEQDPNAWRRLTAEEQTDQQVSSSTTGWTDDEKTLGSAEWWDGLMETAERGEAVDQAEVETDEAVNARIQGAMSEWMKSLNQVSAQAEVRSDLPEEHRGLGQKVKDVASSAYRQFVDSGAEIEKMGKELGDKTLYPYYNAARQSTSAAGYMLQEGGRQISVAGETVGPSLADIFQPIRSQGDDYYIAFQTFLYHMHNIDRMSRDNGTNISEALRQINEFDEMMSATRPELATMPEIDLMQAAAFGDEAAQQRMELLNAYKRAKGVHNKSVFSNEVTAAKSREEAAALLRAHPEFAKLATQVYTYSDNLLQYRVDSGLVTQEFADYLREIYPHYVPTYRVTEGPSAGGKKKGARVGKTVGRATGGNGDLMPLHMALAQQTAQVVRNGTLNRMGRRILNDYDQNRQTAGKYIYKVEEAAQTLHEDTFDLLEDPTPERENTFTIYEDGKALQLTLSKGMYQAIDALMPKGSGWRSEDSYKIPARATTLFKELTTGKNPGFLIRNFFRDLQEGVVYSESTLRWLKNFPKAYEGIAKNSPEWQLFQSLGGVYSSVFDYQKGYKLEESGKNIAQRFLGKVEAANSVIEMAPRFAEFLAYLEKHGRSQDSIMEALNRAAEITTNFGKGGEAGKFLNRTFVPFLNPGIQGANKMLKTALGRNGAKACMKLWLWGAGVLGLGVRVLNDLVNGDDEDYENIRDSAKDTNWLIPIGDGRYIKIPMGRDASSLGVIASRLIGMAHGDKVDWGDAANTIMNQSAPSNPLKTNILAAWFDADLLDADSPGKTWYGGNIESQRLQSLAPGQRFDEDTDYFSKWLGGVLNVSPKKINYVLDQYSGVVGEYVLPLITPSKNKSIVSTFTSNFVLDGVTQNSLSSDFYSTSDKIKYAKNGGDGAMAVVSRFWGKQSDAVSDLNKALRELENDTTLPNKEKQKKIREAKAVIGGVQKNALEVLEKYEAAARKHYTGDSDAEIKRAYREANREVFGAEYALQVHDKKVYERAVAANRAGVDFDTYYKAYFATRGTDGKEMKDSQKRNVLKGMNVSDEVKIALYSDLVTDGRDEDIAAAKAAGLPFNKFLEAQNKHSEINAKKGLTNNTKQAEFAQWMDNQLLTVKQQTALKEAFGFYSMVRAGESKYETLTQVGWDSDTAWDVSKKLDMLLPPPGKEAVTSTQKARVIVNNVRDNTKRLAALAEFVDEGTYNKLDIAYQYGVDPMVFVFYKEQVEGIRAQTGKDSLTQRQTEVLLRRFARISDKERAALWQLQNTSWKAQSNPFDRSVGQRVYAVYQKRKGK